MKIYVKDVQYLVKHCPSEDSPQENMMISTATQPCC